MAEVNVGQASVHTGASNLHFRNNLILGENPESQKNYLPDDFRGIFYMDTYTSYTTSDYNGFRPNEGYDMQFGARPLKRVLQKKVLDGLSIAILEGKVQPGMHVKIDVENGIIQFKAVISEKNTEVFESELE